MSAGTSGTGNGTAAPENVTAPPPPPVAANATAPQGGSSDTSGKSYEQLVALGIPLQCQITSINDNVSVTSTVYMAGTGEIRSETPMPASGPCPTSVMIMKGGNAYMGCIGGTLFGSMASGPFAGCDWMEMSLNQTTNQSTSVTASVGASTSPPDFTNAAPAQISCVPWVYDASKFTVNGNACNLDDIMKQLTTQYGSTGG